MQEVRDTNPCKEVSFHENSADSWQNNKFTAKNRNSYKNLKLKTQILLKFTTNHR